MSLALSTAVRSARAQTLADLLDAGTIGGKVELYSTTQPAAGGAAGGSPQVTIRLQKPCGTVTDGVLAFATTAPGQVTPGGDVLWARLYDGDNVWIGDGDVGITGDPDAAFTLDDNTLLLGAFVFLSGATLTEP